MNGDADKRPIRDSQLTETRSGQGRLWRALLLIGVASLALVIGAIWFFRPGPAVVVYCAQDQVYAEPVFKKFKAETGIRVLAVYDSEAVKTVGLVNRLLAESRQPRADLFWGNEEFRARQLAERNLFATNGLAFFGSRSRRLVVNTNTFDMNTVPGSWLELTNSRWGKIAFGYPQFGTTATHFHALRQHWGDAVWRSWCRALASRDNLVVDGNSMVVRMVAAGEAVIGMTDSDDIVAAQREGAPVVALPLHTESLLIPNAIGLVAGGPNPNQARVLFEFLQSPAIVEGLVKTGALERALVSETEPVLRPDWASLLRDLHETVGFLNEVFLR